MVAVLMISFGLLIAFAGVFVMFAGITDAAVRRTSAVGPFMLGGIMFLAGSGLIYWAGRLAA